jgi:hypothetical protein
MANMQKTGSPGLRRPRKKGITIVETVVALMIFMLCIGGFCAIVMQSRQLSDQARDHYTAVNLARSRFERARTFAFDQLDLFSESGTIVDNWGNPNAKGNFRRSTVVSNVNDRLTEMSVTIEVRDRVTRQFVANDTLKMYFADYIEVPES